MYEHVCNIFESFGSLAEIGEEIKFGQKQPVRTCRLFPNFDKNTDFEILKAFGGGLEYPNVLIFEHLNR